MLDEKGQDQLGEAVLVLNLHIINTAVQNGIRAMGGGSGSFDGSGNQTGSRQAGGIGLQNLNLRLRHMFGEEYGLGSLVHTGAGTTATVSVPLPQKEEKHEHSDS